LHHFGFALSGVMRIAMDDGRDLDIPAGSAFEIPPGHDGWTVGDEPWVAIVWTSVRSYALPPGGPGRRVLETVLFTDVVDSTAILDRIGDTAWRELLSEHNARLREELNEFRGREIATTGDGFLAVFDSATRAVQAGIAMSQAASRIGIPIRVGIHTGEVEFVGGDIRGVSVHEASRVMSLAEAEDVLISSTTRDLLDGSDLQFDDLGPQTLKGLAGARRIYRVLAAPPATPAPVATSPAY
jgi:class 3 adenylate cyclase